MPISILFTCLGNICRSPLAEAIFKHLVIKRGLMEHFEIDSCGTSRYHLGDNPDHRTVKVAQAHNIPISHKGRQIQASDIEQFNIIVAMDSNNLHDIKRIKTGLKNKSKIILMRDYDTEEAGTDVPDPYFGGDKGFEDVFSILNRSCRNMLNELVEEHGLK